MTKPHAGVDDELALLAACWRSIGLRGAVVKWELSRHAFLDGSLASRMRSALGPALVAAGVRPATLQCIVGGQRAPAQWFLGWDCPPGPALRLRAELRCVGAMAADWPQLAAALARMRFPPASRPGPLASTVRCSITWSGAPRLLGTEFGPPLMSGQELSLSGGASVLEALTPLQLRSGGRKLEGPPTLAVLVRSAGERLRQLCLHWGAGADRLPPVVARAYREAMTARLSWATTATPEAAVVRLSRSIGERQVLGGMGGIYAYEGVTSLAMTFLAVAAEIGVGKGTAFGCGRLRIYGGRAQAVDGTIGVADALASGRS